MIIIVNVIRGRGVRVSDRVMITGLFVKTASACVNLTAASQITDSLIVVSDAAAEITCSSPAT